MSSATSAFPSARACNKVWCGLVVRRVVVVRVTGVGAMSSTSSSSAPPGGDGSPCGVSAAAAIITATHAGRTAADSGRQERTEGLRKSALLQGLNPSQGLPSRPRVLFLAGHSDRIPSDLRLTFAPFRHCIRHNGQAVPAAADAGLPSCMGVVHWSAIITLAGYEKGAGECNERILWKLYSALLEMPSANRQPVNHVLVRPHQPCPHLHPSGWPRL